MFAYTVSHMEDASQEKTMIFVVPLVFLAFILIFPLSGEARDPYLDLTARIGRATISAIFGVVLLLGSVVITKLFKGKS